MSSTTWTLTEVASSAARQSFPLWRAVEAQHVVSTTVLTDSLDEQTQLEELLETSKPVLTGRPPGLHWLLFTPFRYPPLPRGSRFRGPSDPGVFYGADEIRTACAELGYWRWRFVMESPALAGLDPKPQTVFRVGVEALTVDLRTPPWDHRRTVWTAPDDYSGTQAFARCARDAGVEAIRYESVRDPARRGCAGVLTLRAFATPAPVESQTWLLTVTRDRVVWQREDVLQPVAFELDMRVWHLA